MTRLTAILTTIVAVALVLGPSVARAQYSTPLRYDLRYTSPSYIPSGTLRTGPPRQADPYRFGNPLHGNLGLTGNLRLGKSFQGNTPYVQTGSQLSQSLPSTALSNFRRDSFGVGDLGTPLQYGQAGAFFPDTATVTTPSSAGRRFEAARFRDRAGYLPPNFSGAPTGPPQTPGNIFTRSGGWIGLTHEDAEAAEALGYTVGVAQSTAEVLESLRALRAGYALDEETEEPSADVAGRRYPYELFEKQFQTDPMNLFGVEPAADARQRESGYERTMQLQYRPEATDLDPWLDTVPQDDDLLVEPGEARAPDETVTDRWATRGGWTEERRADPDDPWAAFDTADPLQDVDGLGPAAEPVRPVSVPTEPRSGYAQFVLRAHEAMKQGRYGQAESLYAAAAALDRKRPAAFFGRVHALLATRLYLQAAAVVKRGLSDHPDWVRHVPDLAAVYPEKDVYTRIRRDLRRSVDRGSAQPGYRFLLAYVEMAVGNAEAARSHLPAPGDASGAEKAMLDALGAG